MSLVAVSFVIPLLLVGVPLLVLRRHRPAGCIALIIGEALTVAMFVLTLPSLTAGRYLRLSSVPLGMWSVLAIVTIGALTRPSARCWSARDAA